MAEIDFDEFDSGYASHRGSSSRWVNLVGAACSVALIIGVAVWGYRLAVRDVAGIPVVRAIEGPLRMQPSNPGGEVALHQGLSVNAVASAGTVAPLPDTLTLAPQDVDLAAEDAAGMAVLSELEAAEAAPSGGGLAVSTLSDSPVSARPVEVAAMPVTELPAEIEADLSTDLAVSEPLPATEEEAVAAALAAALAPELTEEAAPAAVVASLRPRARPAALTTATVDPALAAVPVTEIDPSTIVVGTRLVQLGAFDDAEGARGEWARLAAQFPELLSTKSMVIQTAESGGRTFFRLRAYGFETDGDSRRFCAAFLAENASCIPVSQR